MRFSLFPKDEKFFIKFDQQAELILRICQQFHDFLKEWSPDEVIPRVAAICQVEGEGDELLHEMSLQLAQTFITPIDREDIHLLAHNLDDVLDFIQGAAMRMRLFEVGEPLPGLVEMAEILLECAKILRQGISRLPRFEDISELRKQLSTLETRGDKVNRRAVAGLFNDCTSVPDVLALMKWKEIIESTEEAVDRFEDAFDVLESVVIKHA